MGVTGSDTTIPYLQRHGLETVTYLIGHGNKNVGCLRFETFLFVASALSRCRSSVDPIQHSSSTNVKATFLALLYARPIKECRKNTRNANLVHAKMSVLRRKTQ